MIGIDTNVLVRYIAQDDANQSQKATQLIESLSAEMPGFVTLISVVELIWVMQGCYKATKTECAAILQTLLRTSEILLENAELIAQALNSYNLSNADFADCLIVSCANHAKCSGVMTFDKNAANTAGMLLIE
ncbi:MAG: type II toxin-antitoxin system VapC family toxin [Pseudomonadota bacterium]